MEAHQLHRVGTTSTWITCRFPHDFLQYVHLAETLGRAIASQVDDLVVADSDRAVVGAAARNFSFLSYSKTNKIEKRSQQYNLAQVYESRPQTGLISYGKFPWRGYTQSIEELYLDQFEGVIRTS